MINVADVQLDLEIDFRSKTPSYIQLADKLRAAIDQGLLKPNEAIPSLKQLTAESGLATNTVLKAVSVLEREHRVWSVRGRGTFVTSRNLGAKDSGR